MRLHEYWQEQVKIRKKRWNNKEIKKFYWKFFPNADLMDMRKFYILNGNEWKKDGDKMSLSKIADDHI